MYQSELFATSPPGTGHVLIGDPNDDMDAENAGAAYLFDLAGTLITTYTNPIPAAEDNFGNAVAGMDLAIPRTVVSWFGSRARRKECWPERLVTSSPTNQDSTFQTESHSSHDNFS